MRDTVAVHDPAPLRVALARAANARDTAGELTTAPRRENQGTNGRSANGAAFPEPGQPVTRASADNAGAGQPLSPELVLVSPQLRAEALNALPERPWEAFLPLAPATPPAVAPSLGPAIPDTASGPIEELSIPTIPSGSRFGRDATLVAIALVVGFVAAQFVPHWARRTLSPSAANSPSVPTPAPSSTVAGSTKAGAPGAKPSTHTRAGSPSPRSGGLNILAVANGGYVFGRSGRFQVARDRRTVRRFQARVKCAGQLVLPPLPLLGGNRFSYRGQVRTRKGPVRLEVSGRFLERSRVRGFVRARSAGCDSGNVHFLARLS
jgi:hypothetical protein